MRYGSNTANKLDFSDYIVALLFCVVFTVICALASAQIIHWFILPLIADGVLIGVDAVGWFRRKYDLFDPKGLLGVLGLHFFFTAPLLVVIWEVHTPVTAITLYDYRPWLGLLAILNLFGLLIYRLVEHTVSHRPYNETSARVWMPNQSTWFMVLAVCIIVAVAAEAYVIFGHGYVGTISYESAVRTELKGGLGIYILLGDAGPILLMILLTLIHNRHGSRQSSVVSTYILMAFMAAFSLVSGGLVGSRGATVWKMFWIVGIVHFFWRRFSIKEAMMGLIALVLFMNIYGFFKKLGTKGLEIFRTEGFAAAAHESGITIRGILIGDLSRANVNAYMAYVLVEKPYPYRYRWGKTIVGDILVQFPMWIYRNSFNTTGTSGKMKAGTDLMMGEGHYDPGNPFSKSRYVYGLIGQVMLNFGILPIPLAFIILGYCVGRFRRAMLNWKPYDLRFFFAPVAAHLLTMVLEYDLENQLNTLIFSVSLPLVVVWLISDRLPRGLVDEQEEELTEIEESVPLAY